MIHHNKGDLSEMHMIKYAYLLMRFTTLADIRGKIHGLSQQMTKKHLIKFDSHS